jgi:hypothetical protein
MANSSSVRPLPSRKKAMYPDAQLKSSRLTFHGSENQSGRAKNGPAALIHFRITEKTQTTLIGSSLK